MKFALCSKCGKVSYSGRHHPGVCSYCGSKAVVVSVKASPLYVTGILLILIASFTAYLYEPLQLWERAALVIGAIVAGYALILKGVNRMTLAVRQTGKGGGG